MRPRLPRATAVPPLVRRCQAMRTRYRLDQERSSTIRSRSRPVSPVAIRGVRLPYGTFGVAGPAVARHPKLAAVHPVVVGEEGADRFEDEGVDIANGPDRAVGA